MRELFHFDTKPHAASEAVGYPMPADAFDGFFRRDPGVAVVEVDQTAAVVAHARFLYDFHLAFCYCTRAAAKKELLFAFGRPCSPGILICFKSILIFGSPDVGRCVGVFFEVMLHISADRYNLPLLPSCISDSLLCELLPDALPAESILNLRMLNDNVAVIVISICHIARRRPFLTERLIRTDSVAFLAYHFDFHRIPSSQTLTVFIRTKTRHGPEGLVQRFLRDLLESKELPESLLLFQVFCGEAVVRGG